MFMTWPAQRNAQSALIRWPPEGGAQRVRPEIQESNTILQMFHPPKSPQAAPHIPPGLAPCRANSHNAAGTRLFSGSKKRLENDRPKMRSPTPRGLQNGGQIHPKMVTNSASKMVFGCNPKKCRFCVAGNLKIVLPPRRQPYFHFASGFTKMIESRTKTDTELMPNCFKNDFHLGSEKMLST